MKHENKTTVTTFQLNDVCNCALQPTAVKGRLCTIHDLECVCLNQAESVSLQTLDIASTALSKKITHGQFHRMLVQV